MNETTAQGLMERWIKGVPLDPDVQSEQISQLRYGLQTALRDLLPEPIEATVLNGDEGWPEVLALGEEWLFRVLRGEEAEGGVWLLGVRCYPLSELRPTVGERLLVVGNREHRRRAWGFVFPGYSFNLVTEDPVDRAKRFARALARTIGWPIPSAATAQ